MAQSQIVHENNELIEEEEHAVNHFEESLDAPAKQAWKVTVRLIRKYTK